MKVLANETKRILAVLLSVAMIFAYVPNNVAAYADDDVSGNDTVVEDATEAPTEQATEQSVIEENGVEDERQDALDDLLLDLNSYTAAANNIWGFTYVNGGKTDNYRAVANALVPKNLELYLKDDTTAIADAADASVGIDSEKDFSFVISPKAGYKFKKGGTNVVKAIRYGKYTKGNLSSRESIDIDSSKYTVTTAEGYNTGSVMVTIDKSALGTIKAGLVSDDSGKTYGREIVLVLGDEAEPATYEGVSSVKAVGGLRMKAASEISDALFDGITNADLEVALSDFIKNSADATLAALTCTITVKKGDVTVYTLAASNKSKSDITGTTIAGGDWGGIAKDTKKLQINKGALAEAYSKAGDTYETVLAGIIKKIDNVGDGSESNVNPDGEATTAGTTPIAIEYGRTGSWTIAKNALTADTQFYVYTSEFVPTDEFTTVFAGSGFITANGIDQTKKVAYLETKDIDTGKKVIVGNYNNTTKALKVAPQSLKLAASNSTIDLSATKFYPYANAAKSVLGPAISGTLTYDLLGDSDIADVDTATAIQGLTAGTNGEGATDTILATLTTARATVDTDTLRYNELVYTADDENSDDITAKLPLEVVSRYSDVAVTSNSPAIYALSKGEFNAASGQIGSDYRNSAYMQSLALTAKDNISGLPVTLDAETDADVASIAFAFYPSTADAGDPTHKFVDNVGANLTETGVDTQGGDNAGLHMYGSVNTGSEVTRVSNVGHTAYGNHGLVYVISKKVEPVAVACTMTYADISHTVEGAGTVVTTKGTKVKYEEGNAYTFNSIKDPSKTYFGILKTEGDVYMYGLGASTETFTPTLGLNTNDPKTFTLKYDVYELVDSTLTPSTLTDEGKLNAALKDERIKAVTTGVTYDPAYVEQLAGEFVTVDGDGPWTITAAKANGTLTKNSIVISSVFVNGVEVESAGKSTTSQKFTITPNVVDKVSNTTKLNLIAYDIDEDDNVTSVTVDDTYYSKFPHSKIEGTYENASLDPLDPEFGKVIGSSLTSMADGVSIRLPKQSELKNVPAGRVLVGWAEMDKFEAATTPDIDTLRTSGGYGSANVVSSMLNGTGGTVGTTYNSYVLKPGDIVRMQYNKGAASYRAIWVDSYQLTGLYNKNIPVLDEDDEITYPVALDDTVAKSNIPVVIHAVVVDDVDFINGWTGSEDFDSIDEVTAALYLGGDDEYIEDFELVADKAGHPEDFTAALTDISITPKSGSGTSLVGPVLKGEKNTGTKTAVVTGKYTSSDGKVFSVDSKAFKVADTYSLSMNLLKAGTAVTSINIEAGAEATEITPALTKSGTGSVNLADEGQNLVYHFDYTTGDGVSVKAKGKTDADYYIANVKGTAVTAAAVPVVIKVTDKNGITAPANLNVTVGKGDYTVDFVSTASLSANSLTTLDARAGIPAASLATNEPTEVYVRTVDSNGNPVIEGDWVVTGDDKVVIGTQSSADDASGTGLRKVKVATKDVIDKGELTVKFTPKGLTSGYDCTIPVNTFATIRFIAPAAKTATVDYVVTKDGTESDKRISEADKKSYTDLNLFKTDGTLDKDKKVISFDNVDISKYSMTYKDTSSSPVEKVFKDWTPDGGTSALTTTIESLEWNGDFDTVGSLGIYELTGEMSAKVTITGLPNTITIDDSTTGSVAVFDDIKVSPVTAVVGANTLGFSSDTLNIFTFDDAGSNNPGTAVGPTFNPLDEQADSYSNGVRSYAVSFKKKLKSVGNPPRAGKATLSFYTVDGSELTGQKVTLYVNGLDTVNDVTSYYENGEKVKNDKRTVGTVTYYFDEDGKQVTGTKIIELGGKKVLIVGGMVASPGRQSDGTNEYYVGQNGEIQYGWLTKTGAAATVANGVYYADPTTGALATSELKKFDSDTYYFDALSEKVKGTATSGYSQDDASGYYVDPTGKVAIAQLFNMGGKQYLANEKGELVTYASTVAAGTEGKATVDGIKYVIAKDDTAKRDDILYNPVVTMTPFPSKWYKSSGTYPVVTYTGTVTSANTGNQIPISGNAVVTSDPATISANALEATFTARVDLSQYSADKEGKTKAEGVTQSTTYRFKDGGDEGISKIYTYKSHKFTWPKQISLPGKPAVTATVTYTVTQDGAAQPDETLDATVAVSDGTVGGKYTAFTATLTDINGQTKEETQKYDAKGKLVEGGSGDSPSEPEQSEVIGAAQNLWYTDVELKLPLESGVTYAVPTEKSQTKWTPYYKVDVTSGDVSVIPTDAKTRKKAASAAGSLIILNIVDDSNNVTGEFRYALPVYFQKPSLKLSATSGTVVTGKEGIVRTKVTEKKSNGMYEPVDLSDQKDGVALYTPKNSVVTNIDSDENEVQITATGKTGGKINVQLNNWCEPVSLTYNIKQSSKTVLTLDKKQVLMNSNVDDGEEQAVFLNVNGSDWTSDSEVSVTYPKNFDQKNIAIEGITDGKVTDNEIKISYISGKAPVKGSYTLTFKASDGGKATFKVVVSNAKLDAKAVTLKIKTKMDLTKKQKLVLEPTLKGIGGTITNAEFKNSQKDVFDVEYVEELNQIYVTPTDWKNVSAQNYTESMVLTVGGKECVAALKFKPLQAAPSVKIDKVTLPKSKITASGNNAGGEANVLCTYKTGGKTFTLDPAKVEFDCGNGSTYDASTGYVKMKNGATMRLFYNSEGKIVVEDYQQAKGKGSSVKVKLTFDGYSKTITKTFKIAVVNK